MNYIKDMIIDKANGTITFFLQTDDEPEIWYWTVYAEDVGATNYLEFVNDERNSTLGCSTANFATLKEAKANYYSEIEE